jgi:Outer membrane protein beta-barrel domain
MSGKVRYILFLLNLVHLSVEGQYRVGIEGGPDLNHLRTDLAGMTYVRNRSTPGPALGIDLSYMPNRHWAFAALPSLLKKDHCLARTGPYAGAYESMISSYLQIPLLVRRYLRIGKTDFFIEGGPYGAYWIAGRLKGKIPDIFSVSDSITAGGQLYEQTRLVTFNQPYFFNRQVDRRWEFGTAVALGAQLPVNKKDRLRVRLGYYQALTNTARSAPIASSGGFNQTMQLMFGYLHDLGKKNKRP